MEPQSDIDKYIVNIVFSFRCLRRYIRTNLLRAIPAIRKLRAYCASSIGSPLWFKRNVGDQFWASPSMPLWKNRTKLNTNKNGLFAIDRAFFRDEPPCCVFIMGYLAIARNIVANRMIAPTDCKID